MDDNCRPLEHFNFLQDGQWAENMHKPNRLSVHHPRAPSPLCPSSSSFCCFVESKEKGLKIQQYPEEHSHRIPGFDIQSTGGHMTDCITWGIAHSHVFVLFVIIWYIIFCLYKTGPRETTQHITSFLFVLFFLPKPGEKKLHFCTIACYKML